MVSDLCNVILSFDTATCRISRQRQTLQQIYLCYEDAEDQPSTKQSESRIKS